MVCGFEVGADFVEGEPGGFEFAASVEDGLVHVVPALRISAGAEGVDGEGANLWTKLDHADIGSTGNTVAALLSTDRRGVKSEDSAIVAIHAADRKTRAAITKLFVLAFINTLKTGEFAPRNFPRAEITLKCIAITSVSAAN